MAYTSIRTITINHSKVGSSDRSAFVCLFDPSRADVLGSSMTSGSTTATLTTGGQILTGDYIQIDSEIMLVTAGGGTTSLTVTRGQNGTSAASHSSGANVSDLFLATTANGGSVTSGSGYDIIFSASSTGSSPFAYERGWWGATGLAGFFVQVGAVSHTTATTFYVLSGNSAVTTDQSNASGTWSPTNMSQVMHLAESSSPYADSTGNGNGSNAGTYPTQVLGVFNNAQSFLTASSQYIRTNDPVSGGALPWVISAWVKIPAISPLTGGIVDNRISGGYGMVMYTNSANSNANGYFNNLTGSAGFPGTTSVYDGDWHYWVLYITGGAGAPVYLYIDGALQGTSSVSSVGGLGSTYEAIGAAWDGGGGISTFSTSTIQELRVAASGFTDAGTDRFLTDFNNQSSPSTFYTMASYSPPSAGASSYAWLA